MRAFRLGGAWWKERLDEPQGTQRTQIPSLVGFQQRNDPRLFRDALKNHSFLQLIPQSFLCVL